MRLPPSGRGLTLALALACLVLAASGAVTAQSEGAVTEVTVENSSVEVGETVRVTAIVENTGSERATIPATLTLDGESVATREPSVDPAFPVVVTFEVTVDDPGEYTVAVNGAEATQPLTVQSADGGETDSTIDSGEASPTGQASQTVSVNSENVTVQSVELGSSSASVGQPIEVTVTLANTGPDVVNVTVALELDAEVVTTATAKNILSQQTAPGVTIPYTFEYTPERSGTYTLSVNGTEASTQLTVSGGGGGLFGFLGFLPLGFLPLGILRLIGLFVLLPLAAVYLVLKGLALYLGY